jgi:hypothetical protein
MAVFVINSAGVWVVDLISLYLAVFVKLGWGLIGEPDLLTGPFFVPFDQHRISLLI